ncbi:LEAF RUST 10 DISEASE-RESISTANCE LOCUS RECEPTOR-LIKE PROTEIN KINASE-like 2.7 [Vitis riparia]|uniref:LEAF RUST 10 DISEASE-RESISTANCE LOCUS RECEPTOR-LIKE PROTEIN KINASE-like 2.7 n=1 Tax=Vitis riparia TaxID=96939 RepID=UPI00155A8259|nr:LEAF RUST 10 DISEASE-RESISTANCE LOCUS RECEPTOR-LIKE PROTEIN KINASE-like 2.7 [Vitis riparia]
MYLINFFPSPLIISVVVIIFLLSLNFPETACAEDFSYSNCKSLFECGRLRDIGYPFWGNGRPYYCGHPKFELRCERGEPTIEIKSQKYHVLDIHHETQILKIARLLDLFDGNIVCPESNATMDSDFFRYTSNDQNATLFYECELESEPPQTCDLLCVKYGKQEHASFVTDTNLANQLASRCEFSVVVPVLATAAAQGLADHSLHTNDVLGQGFEVEWIIDETQCIACVESGGICRYNSTLQKHFCLCGEFRGQAYPTSCPNPPELPPASNFAESTSSSPNHFHHPLQMHLIFSVFIFFLSHRFPKSVSTDDVQFSNCNPSFQCGGLGKIEYPFLARWPPAPSRWASGDQPALPEWRGHHWDQYRVIDIDYNAQVLKIGTINNGSKGACPHPNATIDPSLMSYTSKVENATFLFDCWQYEDHPGSYGFTCEMDDLQLPSYFVVNTSLANELGSKCGERVVIPVLGTAAQTLLNHSLGVDGLLREGFEVEWEVEEEEECGECVESGGGCG